jgi:hypothetical protein
MALEKCPECEGQLSTTARTCPHCGYVRVPKMALAIALAGMVMLLGIAAAFLLATPYH